jgi:multimeric flavodoxin WrbA
VLVICGSPRNDGSCPGEMSKSYRLALLTQQQIDSEGMEVDLFDLSLPTSEYQRHIHPCKGCVSTAMPLCHWPCRCYPNHALGEVNDWMAGISERWTAAHGVAIVTPVHWYQSPSVLKSMIDRLVCAEGGNPDPSSRQGKRAVEARQLELDGSDCPKHLAGRVYGLVVHGDVAGIEGVRRALSDWLDRMGFIEARPMSRLDRFAGYYEPYATSHPTLDADEAFREEVRDVARGVAQPSRDLRAGTHRISQHAAQESAPEGTVQVAPSDTSALPSSRSVSASASSSSSASGSSNSSSPDSMPGEIVSC